MATCNNCKFGTKVPNYEDRYYCSKLIYENQDTHNKEDFGCVRGVKK